MPTYSMDIRYFWPTYQGTWWDWTRRKLWELPFYVASCFFYGILYIFTFLVIAYCEHSKREYYFAVSSVLLISLFFLVTKPILDLVIVMLIVGFVKLVSDLLENYEEFVDGSHCVWVFAAAQLLPSPSNRF